MALMHKAAACSLEVILGRGTSAICVRSVVSWKRRGTFKRIDTPSPDNDLLWRSEGRRNLTHRESAKYPGEYDEEFPKGKIYDKKSFPMELKAGKKYSFCTCGYSKMQPLCDGWHKKVEGTTYEKTTPKYRPLVFTVEETKEYSLCNCKQSNNRPFCDGSHKKEEIQSAVK